MSKKTNLRKNTIISLSDQNEAELRKISKEKDQVLSTFEQRKEGTVVKTRNNFSIKFIFF